MNYCNRMLLLGLMTLLAAQSYAELQIDNPWVALAPPAATANAAYMDIYNPQVQAQKIVALSADCCALVMLHQMRRDGDKMLMEHREDLIVPAKGRVSLEPGGLHIMLMKPNAELQLGSEITITFTFADGSKQSIALGVKKHDL